MLILQLDLFQCLGKSGAWWSSGLTRYVEAMPRVEGSKQAVSSSFSSFRHRERTSSKLERRNAGQEIMEQVIHSREKKGGSGDEKKKAGTATTFVSKVEWLRERLSVRTSNSIKW